MGHIGLIRQINRTDGVKIGKIEIKKPSMMAGVGLWKGRGGAD